MTYILRIDRFDDIHRSQQREQTPIDAPQQLLLVGTA
jgi:hypothetical protein